MVDRDLRVGMLGITDRDGDALDARPGQVALAWVLAQGDDVVPIPGRKRRTYLDENVGSLDVELTAADLAELNALLESVVGDRYPGNAGIESLDSRSERSG